MRTVIKQHILNVATLTKCICFLFGVRFKVNLNINFLCNKIVGMSKYDLAKRLKRMVREECEIVKLESEIARQSAKYYEQLCKELPIK